MAIGEDIITNWSTLEESGFVLHILTPTDCVRDRLAWFLFNSDYSSLEQALAVATSQEIDLSQIKEWAIREGEGHKFQVFISRLAGNTD